MRSQPSRTGTGDPWPGVRVAAHVISALAMVAATAIWIGLFLGLPHDPLGWWLVLWGQAAAIAAAGIVVSRYLMRKPLRTRWLLMAAAPALGLLAIMAWDRL